MAGPSLPFAVAVVVVPACRSRTDPSSSCVKLDTIPRGVQVAHFAAMRKRNMATNGDRLSAADRRGS